MTLQEEISSALIEWINDELVGKLKDEMNAKDINASRNLTQSIKVSRAVVNANMEVVADVLMEYYWKYINYGVNGLEVNNNAPTHGSSAPNIMSFKESILEWIPHRGYTLPVGFKSYEQWAYAIMTNIRRRGAKPRPFVNDAIKNIDTSELASKITAILANKIREENGDND